MTTVTQPDAIDFTGVDDLGNEYLLTIWVNPDGTRTRTLSSRPLGAATWGAPVAVDGEGS